MCIAIPAKIISVDDYHALAETLGVRQKINIQLIRSPRPGDNVLVHAGFAIEKIDEERYTFLNETFLKMAEADEHKQSGEK